MSTLILCFHRVADPESGGRSKLAIGEDDFEFVLDTVGRKYEFVSPADGVKPSKARRAVVTFDDGYADNLHTAAPILEERGIPATFFLTTGFLGTNLLYPADALDGLFDWLETGNELPRTLAGFQSLDYWQALRKVSEANDSDFWKNIEQISALCREQVLSGDPLRRPMTLDEVREVQSRGIGLAPHTHSHRRLTALSVEDALEDVRLGTQWFDQHGLDIEPFFAYPFGQSRDVSRELTRGIRAFGYEPLTTIPTLVTHQTKRKFASLGLPRLSVGPLEVPKMALFTQIFPWVSNSPAVWLSALKLRRKLVKSPSQDKHKSLG